LPVNIDVNKKFTYKSSELNVGVALSVRKLMVMRQFKHGRAWAIKGTLSAENSKVMTKLAEVGLLFMNNMLQVSDKICVSGKKNMCFYKF
jgi:hypothetical protein